LNFRLKADARLETVDMRNRTFIAVVVAAALIAAAAVSMRAHGGGALHRWFSAIHGR
jgi:hypothetical protein